MSLPTILRNQGLNKKMSAMIMGYMGLKNSYITGKIHDIICSMSLTHKN